MNERKLRKTSADNGTMSLTSHLEIQKDDAKYNVFQFSDKQTKEQISVCKYSNEVQ